MFVLKFIVQFGGTTRRLSYLEERAVDVLEEQVRKLNEAHEILENGVKGSAAINNFKAFDYY